MKYTILLLFISVAFIPNSFSQTNTAFAVTGQGKGDFNWSDIRSIDMNSGNVQQVLFQNGKTPFSFINAETFSPVESTEIPIPASGQLKGNVLKIVAPVSIPSPTLLMSAAMAYDKIHGKLFFASMKTGKLIWLDLNANNDAPKFYTVDKPLVRNSNFADESFNITRMTIGANGNGYALTNDANHLISFTTGSKTIITDLGNLVDAESNKGISIHNKCSSWGGDIVGEAFGKIYLFTAAQNVFQIDVPSKIATYKGRILNLPATFSVNGAAVDRDGHVIVSSANTFEGFYKINMNDLSASKLTTTGQVFNASDLASGYLLNQKQATMDAITLPQVDVIGNRFISIYPNPVPDGQIKIAFENKLRGEYKIELSDLQGRLIDYKKVYINSEGQLENFKLQTKPVKGLYLIKVTDVDKKSVFSDKLLIE